MNDTSDTLGTRLPSFFGMLLLAPAGFAAAAFVGAYFNPAVLGQYPVLLAYILAVGMVAIGAASPIALLPARWRKVAWILTPFVLAWAFMPVVEMSVHKVMVPGPVTAPLLMAGLLS